MINKTILIFLLLIIVACTTQFDKSSADSLIQKFDELKKIAEEHEIKVKQIAQGEFTFEKAEQARKEIILSIDYYEESLDANEDAIKILESLKNSSLDEIITQRKYISQRTAKITECNNLSLELLNTVIAHGETTYTSEIKELMSKEKKCGEELQNLEERFK